jgi:hypothetical protein
VLGGCSVEIEREKKSTPSLSRTSMRAAFSEDKSTMNGGTVSIDASGGTSPPTSAMPADERSPIRRGLAVFALLIVALVASYVTSSVGLVSAFASRGSFEFERATFDVLQVSPTQCERQLGGNWSVRPVTVDSLTHRCFQSPSALSSMSFMRAAAACGTAWHASGAPSADGVAAVKQQVAAGVFRACTALISRSGNANALIGVDVLANATSAGAAFSSVPGPVVLVGTRNVVTATGATILVGLCDRAALVQLRFDTAQTLERTCDTSPDKGGPLVVHVNVGLRLGVALFVVCIALLLSLTACVGIVAARLVMTYNDAARFQGGVEVEHELASVNGKHKMPVRAGSLREAIPTLQRRATNLSNSGGGSAYSDAASRSSHRHGARSAGAVSPAASLRRPPIVRHAESNGRLAEEDSEFNFDRPTVANAEDVHISCDLAWYPEATVVAVRYEFAVSAKVGKENDALVHFLDGLYAAVTNAKRRDSVICDVSPRFQHGLIFYGKQHAAWACRAALQIKHYALRPQQGTSDVLEHAAAFNVCIVVTTAKALVVTSGQYEQRASLVGPITAHAERLSELYQPLIGASSSAGRCPVITGARTAELSSADSHLFASLPIDLVASMPEPAPPVSPPHMEQHEPDRSDRVLGDFDDPGPLLPPPASNEEEHHHFRDQEGAFNRTDVNASVELVYSLVDARCTAKAFSSLGVLLRRLLEAIAGRDGEKAAATAEELDNAFSDFESSHPFDAMAVDRYLVARIMAAAQELDASSRTSLFDVRSPHASIDPTTGVGKSASSFTVLPRSFIGWGAQAPSSLNDSEEWRKFMSSGRSNISLNFSRDRHAQSTDDNPQHNTSASANGAGAPKVDADILEEQLNVVLAEKERAAAEAIEAAAKAAAEAPAEDEDEDGGGFSLFSFVATPAMPPPEERQTEPRRFTDMRGAEWRMSNRMLGSGAFGNVFLGMSPEGQMVAIKAIRISLKSKDECKNVLKEIRLLVRLKSDRIVQYISSAVVGSFLMIVMEAVGGGSMLGVISQYSALPRKLITAYLRDLLMGLRYLHSNGVIHRDIKPHNVLMTENGRCKLADFGTACHVTYATASEKSGDITGTIVYMAPEACDAYLHVRSDIWAVGIVAYQMVTKRLPYHQLDLNLPFAILNKLGKRNPDEFRPEVGDAPDWIRGFIELCLEFDPDLRPSADDLLRQTVLLVR